MASKTSTKSAKVAKKAAARRASAKATKSQSDFAGRWFTTFGAMNLTQSGSQVQGAYGPPEAKCVIEGTVEDGTFRFRYREPEAQGEGWFVLERFGKFSGQWHQDDAVGWGTWIGFRDFDGVWESSIGPMRLVREEDRVFGCYEVGGSSIEGRVEGEQLN